MSRQPKTPPRTPAISGRRLWLWRLVTAIGGPLLLLALVEISLRLGGYGHPTAFLLPSTNQGRATLIQNNQFGWRFFGPNMSRTPNPISLSQNREPGTIRIFVFGESAAFGDPQPRFGLPRVLQAMLSLRHPGTKFEVVNAAMTGINSHVILPIARDCAAAGGDIWVVYMGNNEVVGPFGAGTVFGPQAPPLPAIRASVALKSSRFGQWIEDLRRKIQKPPLEKSEWGGMTMFLDQQVRADDPRMKNVYANFARNLADIIRAGRRGGAGVVVSTVAVNLRDSAPFASRRRAGLPDADQSKWEQLYQRGIAAENTNNFPEATAEFHAAAQVDDSFADLRFRLGQCLLASGQAELARGELAAARDLDALRFRCDARLNELIRQTASNRVTEHVLLADAERAFAEASRDGLPGNELFYEHVHLTFTGNYLLARIITGQVEQLLPATVAAPKPGWPTLPDCARRLARTEHDELDAVTDMIPRLLDAPFTSQINHEEQIRRFTARARELASANSPAARRAALKLCEDAVAAAPGDPILLEQLALLKQGAGDLLAAEQTMRQSIDLLPSSSGGWLKFGFIEVQQKKFSDAATAFQRAFDLDPQDVWSLQNLALSFAKLDRPEDAIREYRRALGIKPRFGPAWLGLGQVLEKKGLAAESADCYAHALTNRIHRAQELTTLARFCQAKGWFEAAATNYADVIRLNPADPVPRFEAGQSLSALGRHDEAAEQFLAAANLSPGWGQAHFLGGLELGRLQRPADAEREFRATVELMPDLIEARVNLGIALSSQNKFAEALAEFEPVLERNPTNDLAQRYVQALREKLGSNPIH